MLAHFFFGLRNLLVHHVLVLYIYLHFQLPLSSLSEAYIVLKLYKILIVSVLLMFLPK